MITALRNSTVISYNYIDCRLVKHTDNTYVYVIMTSCSKKPDRIQPCGVLDGSTFLDDIWLDHDLDL